MALAKFSWTADRHAGAGARGFSLLEVLFATTMLDRRRRRAGADVRAGDAHQHRRAGDDLRVDARAGKDGAAARAGVGFRRRRAADHDYSTTSPPSTESHHRRHRVWRHRPTGTLRQQHRRLRATIVDRTGKTLGGGATPPANTVYMRRWSVEPLPTNPNNTLILQVLVIRNAQPRRGRQAAGVDAGAGRGPPRQRQDAKGQA